MCLSVQLISFPYLDAHIQTKQLTTHCDSTFHTPALNVQFGRSAISQICIDRFLFFLIRTHLARSELSKIIPLYKEFPD